jgi:hypothetical protein
VPQRAARAELADHGERLHLHVLPNCSLQLCPVRS